MPFHVVPSSSSVKYVWVAARRASRLRVQQASRWPVTAVRRCWSDRSRWCVKQERRKDADDQAQQHDSHQQAGEGPCEGEQRVLVAHGCPCHPLPPMVHSDPTALPNDTMWVWGRLKTRFWPCFPQGKRTPCSCWRCFQKAPNGPRFIRNCGSCRLRVCSGDEDTDGTS